MSAKKLFLAAVSVLAITSAIIFAVASASLLHAQSSESDWEKAAGGKMSFDVASVKRNVPPTPVINVADMHFNIAGRLDGSDDFTPSGGLFIATEWPVWSYVAFAYKLSSYQTRLLRSEAPKGVISELFDIQARAAGNPTKDQYRLMTQSLLADRFKLAVRWEKREAPSFDLVLVKPGKTGPQLQRHDDKIACKPFTRDPSGYESIPGQLPAFCGTVVGGGGPGGVSAAARDVTIAEFADAESSIFGRPIIDKTGLTGTFDINMNSKFNMSPSEMQQFGQGDIQSGFIDAFRNQLGLKLEPSTASIDVLVIDHIEEPSPN